MTDEQRRVRSDSDELLESMRTLKDAEQRKRTTTISTDEFHELAEEVVRRADEVWKIADRERLDGEDAPSTGASTADVDPLKEP